MKNKRGDVPSILFAIISIVVVGLLIFFIGHVRNDLFVQFDDYFNSTPDYNESIARSTLAQINTVENAAWDYAFLGIMMGYFLALMLTMFSTRVSPVFYWIYGMIAIVGLLMATILSNMWQQVASNAEFAVTITRFPIMNTVLGTYYPTIITGVTVVAMILLFGKNPGAQQ